MNIGSREIFANSAKPYMRRIAYLESHGTEFIDTKQTTSYDSKFTISLKSTNSSTSGDGVAFGSRTSSMDHVDISLWTNMSKRGFAVHAGFGVYTDTSWIFTGGIDDFRTVEISRADGVIVDSVNYYSGFRGNATMSGTCPIALFALNNSASIDTRTFKGCISHYCQQKNGRLVVDLIPVLDFNGRPCMYDEISGQLFYNQGTGEFTYGELAANSEETR